MNNPTLEKPTVNTELPSPLADIHDRVMEAYYGKLGDQFMRETQSRIHWICAQVKGRRILDVGCSQGIVPLLLAREGCQVTGVDTSPQAIEEAKGYLSAEPAHIQQNVTYINSDFLALDTLEVEPDTVVISEVLEHLVRPELFVEKAYDLLKQGGRLVITVPFGVNDFIDHKHTFYLMEPFRLLAEHLQIIEVKMLGKWLGIVAVKNEAHKPGTIDSLTVDRVRELEKAFESIERTLRENLGSIGARLADANKKYRSATEQIAQLRPEAQKAEALAKQLQTRDTDIATLQQANREILDAKAKRVQELEEIKERLDDANRKYRLATEQLSLLKPEAQKVEALTRQLQDRDAHIISLEQTNQEALEASARSIQELNAELDSLKSQLGEANEKCLATAEQYAQLQQQIAVLEEAQGQRDQELDSLQQSLLSLEEQLLATDQQRAAAEALAANESTKIEALQAQHDALESQLLQVTELQAKGQADNAALNETVSSLQKQRNELESQLEVLSEQLVQAQQLNDGHIETITMLRAQQAALQAKLENQRQAADELQSQAEQTNAGHVDTITALRAQQAALQAALENQQQALASTQAKADESNAAHESTIAALQAQQVELQAELERRAELQTHAEQTNTGHIETITALRAHQAALEAELEGQAQAMTELREQAGLADTARLETISSLQSRVEELDALLGTAVESRDKTLEANTDHINTIASLRELQTAMGTALENQKQALSILQSESSQDIAEKDECIATLRKRQAELEAELESELEYMNELQAQTQRADAAQAETIALLKARQAELEADLGNQRQAMKQAYAAQAETVTALQNRQTELESQLLEMSEIQARGEREHAAQANTINTLVELRNGFEEQVHALTLANKQAQEAQAEQAETIASLNQAKDALVEQLMLETASRQAAEASLAATNEQWQGLRMQLENELNSSKAGLGAANLKYRTVSTEQIPQLKANLNQLLERSAAQQRKIDELNANLERANTQRHLAEQRLVKTRTSMTYQLGYQIKNSANSLGGLVRLPVRLLRLYRKANQQRQQNEQKRIANEPMKALLPPAPVIQDENYLKLPEALPTSEQSRSILLRQADQPASRLKVACVMDEFTFGSYRYECDLMQLTPANWKAELEGFRPELLFIESAWRGKDELWGSKVGHNSQELQDILNWCRQNKVPTVFWNKEDPVHFETFLTTAKQFDHVFTTDIDCIHRYKGALGHDRVYLLPFACQPALHNPIELYERKDAFCFAGAYYARYPERTRDLGNFVCELPKFRPLEIFDRNFGKNDANYQFPEEYQPYIVGTLPFEKIDTAYKGYRYAINLNSIKQSQSMFARRVFELLGCNTITVSNFSRGVRLLFGDLVVTTDNGEEMLRRLQLLAEDPLNSDKLKLAALRKVMQEHTYTQRLEYVLSKVTGTVKAQRLPEIVVVGEAQDRKQFDMLRAHLNRQTYSQVRMVIITDAYQSSIVSDDPRILVLKPAQLKKTSLGELVGNTPWVAGFVPGDYYGPNYLLDLALATRYSQAQVIGKAAHFTCNGQNAQLQSNGLAYRPAQSLSARRSLVATEIVAGQPLRSWLKSLPSLQYTHEQGLAIDPFNYCENGAAQHEAISAKVDDLELNLGMTIDQLQARAQAIAPLEDKHDSPEISGRELAEMFGAKHSKFLNLSVDVDNWRVSSTLADGKHEYVYALKEVSLDQLNLEDRQLKLYLDCTPGLNLQLVVLFLDAEKQRISHVMQHANRNQTSEVPPEAAFVRFGLRAYAAGSSEIKALVLGHRDLQPSEMLGRSKHLVVTNHYPAYADLYRNGFVHSRVMAYKEQNLNVDIFRLRKNEAVSYHEFQNVDVVTGCQSTLNKMLESGQYKSVLVHFLDPEMWEVLKRFTHMVKVVVWVHGAEVQPWWRREYNYSDESQLAVAKVESEKRMAFWRETLSNMPANLKLVFVSRYFAEEVMEDVGFRIPEDRYEIIHNPIDTETFSYQQKPEEQRMKLLSIRPYASAKYANDLSVRAIELLAEKPYFKNLEFRMIGDGVLFEETLAPLRKYSNVTIERGFLKHQEIAALHKQYGLFLCPTRMDAQGVSRDEAMASGLIAVTNAVTAIPEFVDDECGILAAGDDAQGMADGIARVIESPELFSKMSAAARVRVEKQTAKHSIITREIELIR
ncbi:methyltransferase type 12 [Pseudomonas monteilii]|uniref:Methyltransferase type 12 n=1 Tax=Pseudomonas monteilii TaxID=76759 RepID=A0AAP7FLL6_9PSED|nr:MULTISPECIES: glycosyltransferase [Pseudomonas]AYN14936.1 methyltransferase type 12 [Pseudomonas monteilii]AYO01455.1 methyltransferase domain-containing protein [Pseudomonas sp. LTGT-11-2Z]MBA6101189.1 glycosyltransferase [Pseudomonas monteilii]MCE0927557.1 glycosyltransferase [Pseudomonas monteilii]MCE0934015.1 glycosyltransferase [Pseudomonas monteilii]